MGKEDDPLNHTNPHERNTSVYELDERMSQADVI